jgi:RNA polymerase sigma-70 factor (ECF subfamily)
MHQISTPVRHDRSPGAEAAMDEENEEIRRQVECLRRGDDAALEPLFSSYRSRLRRMVELRLDARLRGRVSPSDVLQEVYIDALKRVPHYRADPDVPFFIWLRTVTLQRLVQVHRQHLAAGIRNAAREVPMARVASREASVDMIAAFIADQMSPSMTAQRGETLEQLRVALEGLDATDRQVLALRHFDELTNNEVAAFLDIQPAAASKRYVRALERLRDALERSPDFATEL